MSRICSRIAIYLVKNSSKYYLASNRNNILSPSVRFSIKSFQTVQQLSTSVFLRKLNASFEEVKAVNNTKNVILIDVREPSELQETGVIPGSINIPLGEVESTLKDLPGKDFKNKYGIDKPKSDTPIIFSCKLGKRSATAQEIANKLGYKNVKNFIGGWLEWEEKIKQ